MVPLILLVFACPLLSAISDWTGQWTDNTYGGSVFICVSELTDITIAQGVFSNVGYMRGEINDANLWTGYFWMAGIESRRGSFELALNNSEASFYGLFTDSTGYDYKMSGIRLSGPELTPSDVECFRTSDDLLVPSLLSAPFNFSGTIHAANVKSGSTQSKSIIAFSDSSVRVSWEAPWGRGFNLGSCFSDGQVACVNWYEAGPDEGIELMVARNATTFYSIWIGASSVSDFNYTTYFVLHSGYGIELNSIIDATTSVTEADSYSYLRLLTEQDEDTCYDAIANANFIDDSNDCDNDSGSSSLVVGLVVALVVSLVFNCVSLVTIFWRKAHPESSSRSDIKTNLI
jgi:hypothetical protein